jgi:hypothetical protein
MSVRPGCAPNNGAAPNEGFRLRLVGQAQPVGNGPELRPCQVVKERDYLIDNLCRYIITRRGNEIKGKVDRP